MDEHWQHKKKRSGDMSNHKIDEWYEIGMRNGALGGKLIGPALANYNPSLGIEPMPRRTRYPFVQRNPGGRLYLRKPGFRAFVFPAPLALTNSRSPIMRPWRANRLRLGHPAQFPVR
jgi:hypothetical protein